MREDKIADIERRIGICQEYAATWEEFFKCFGTGDIRERRIFEQDEVRFQKIVVELAHQQFRFSSFMGDKFGDGEKIIDVLERAESLAAIREMPEANFSKFEIDWHQVFISMHRAVGRLMHELPPEEPEEEEEEDAKGKKKRKKKRKSKPPPKKAAPRHAPPKLGAPGAPKLGALGAPRLGVPKPPSGPPRPKGP